MFGFSKKNKKLPAGATPAKRRRDGGSAGAEYDTGYLLGGVFYLADGSQAAANGYTAIVDYSSSTGSSSYCDSSSSGSSSSYDSGSSSSSSSYDSGSSSY